MVGCHKEECQEGTWHPGGAKKSRLKRNEKVVGFHRAKSSGCSEAQVSQKAAEAI